MDKPKLILEEIEQYNNLKKYEELQQFKKEIKKTSIRLTTLSIILVVLCGIINTLLN